MKHKAIFGVLSLLLLGVGALFIFGLDQRDPAPSRVVSEALPGGAATSVRQAFPSFMLPAGNLPQEQRPDFHAGKALAHQPWVKAPTITTARDGLGPIYNARTCLACHLNGGRGHMPNNAQQPLHHALLRLSLAGGDEVRGVLPEPRYGDQLQSQSVALSHQLRSVITPEQGASEEAPPEGQVYIHWQQHRFTYPDGEQVMLRYPQIELRNLGYGELHAETLMGIRNAPPLHGMGLLELIEQQAIDALADPEDRDGDGISGRVNLVWDVETERRVPGRFGLKANRASLRIQTAAAFANDIGISNPLFPEQPCTAAQRRCLRTRNGNDLPAGDEPSARPGVEIPESLLSLVVDFTRNLGVPRRRDEGEPEVVAGRALFYESGCQRCHTPSHVTGASAAYPHLANQTIWPYSDLLLHDMGPALADGRPDYLASGSEWRTPPLWGVGLSKAVNGSDHLLHDGRAQGVEAAILWHGGEAQGARDHFIQLDRAQRQALLRFVESL